jgi:hypothetical protein
VNSSDEARTRALKEDETAVIAVQMTQPRGSMVEGWVWESKTSSAFSRLRTARQRSLREGYLHYLDTDSIGQDRYLCAPTSKSRSPECGQNRLISSSMIPQLRCLIS